MIPSSLSKEEIERFSRQIILPEFGVKGQERLRDASVLVVGAGGLGSPAALYLAAAGVGRLGIVDYDVVEVDNLHRQILHNEERIGMTKVESAKHALQKINSGCKVTAHNILLSPALALQIFPDYDLILDASDNAVTRYLINDVACRLAKPLVSGAALRFDGQLSTYNFGGSSCYRCIYPVPPPAEAVVNCQFGGVLGAVTGIVGSLQALEAIRILSMDYAGKMLKFDGLSGGFRTFKLRGRNPECVACGQNPSIDIASLDYEAFCGSKANDKCQALNILESHERVFCKDLAPADLLDSKKYTIIDVRPPAHFDIARFPTALNIPIEECSKRIEEVRQLAVHNDILVVCRAGNDSQLATRLFKDNGIANVFDLAGGMNAYASQIDQTLPKY